MEEYGRGFGSVGGEHWLGELCYTHMLTYKKNLVFIDINFLTGLNAMNKLTEQGSYTVRFEFEAFDGDTAWAEYR